EPGGGLVAPFGRLIEQRAPIIVAAARNKGPALLRNRLARHLASRCLLCRSHSSRREAGRSPGAVADKIRDGREPQDRRGARPCDTPIDNAARGRGDRMRRRQFLIVFAGLLAASAASAQVGNAPFCLATDSMYGESRTAPIGPGRS